MWSADNGVAKVRRIVYASSIMTVPSHPANTPACIYTPCINAIVAQQAGGYAMLWPARTRRLRLRGRRTSDSALHEVQCAGDARDAAGGFLRVATTGRELASTMGSPLLVAETSLALAFFALPGDGRAAPLIWRRSSVRTSQRHTRTRELHARSSRTLAISYSILGATS